MKEVHYCSGIVVSIVWDFQQPASFIKLFDCLRLVQAWCWKGNTRNYKRFNNINLIVTIFSS